jgi:hypothetical protein
MPPVAFAGAPLAGLRVTRPSLASARPPPRAAVLMRPQMPARGGGSGDVDGPGREAPSPHVYVEPVEHATLATGPEDDDAALRFADVAASCASFLTVNMRAHLAHFVVERGRKGKVSDIALVHEISVAGITPACIIIDVVTCDAGQCVCIREEVMWIGGNVLRNADDIPLALRELSLACGLDDDELS